MKKYLFIALVFIGCKSDPFDAMLNASIDTTFTVYVDTTSLREWVKTIKKTDTNAIWIKVWDFENDIKLYCEGYKVEEYILDENKKPFPKRYIILETNEKDIGFHNSDLYFKQH